jgi:hypothetical protein
MPKPIYIICCQFVSEDKTSGYMSAFNIVDKLLFQKLPEGHVATPFQLHVISSWEKAEGEMDDSQVESELVLLLPPDKKSIRVGQGTTRFAGGKTRLRLTAVIKSLPVEQPGTLEIQVRARQVGAEEWSVQSYPLMLEEQPQKPADNLKVGDNGSS